MRRARTEITEIGERMENYKSIRKKLQKKEWSRQFSVPSPPSVISVWTRPAQLSPLPRPREG